MTNSLRVPSSPAFWMNCKAICFILSRSSPFTLVYSGNCFGTADSIEFYENKGLLRIHDLKTGITPASMHQLEVYAALFCAEYGKRENFKPSDIEMELRIYQNDEIVIANPDPNDISSIMNKIVAFDKEIRKIKGAPYGSE